MTKRFACCSGATCENDDYIDSIEESLVLALTALENILECDSRHDYTIAKETLDTIRGIRNEK